MSWNYRAILHDDPVEPWIGLHEVYYNEDGSVSAWTAEPIRVWCYQDEGIDGILAAFERAKGTLSTEPLLNAKDLPGYQADPHPKRDADRPGVKEAVAIIRRREAALRETASSSHANAHLAGIVADELRDMAIQIETLLGRGA